MANLDLKQLSKVIDLCRKKGVDSIEFDGIKVTLGNQPTPKRTRNKIDHSEDTITETPFDEESTLFWSVPNLPMEGVG